MKENATRLKQHFKAALALHHDGRLAEAKAIYRDILDTDPGHFDALLHLGLTALQCGEPENAIASIRAALVLAPDSAAGHCHLATALQLMREHEEAIVHYEQALAAEPDMAEAYFGLGNAFRLSDRLDEAVASYQRAIAIDPDYAEAHCSLGLAYHAMQLHERALAAYQAALDVDPDYPEAHCGLGRVLQTQFYLPQAAASYRQALILNPDFSAAHLSLGTVLQELDRYDEALDHLDTALLLEPDSADAHCCLGIALRDMGRLDEAQRAFERAIDLQPTRPQHYYLLTNSKHMAREDKHFVAMENLAEDMSSLDSSGQVHLRFALAKALADCGDPAASFDHLAAGNELKRLQISYDEETTLTMLHHIAGLFTADFLRSHQAGGYSTDAPIFIVGMPRSGSTLIEQVLASHPRVFGAGECMTLRDCTSSAGRDTGSDRLPGFVALMTDAQLAKLGSNYHSRMLASTSRRSSTADRYTDKTLNNFCLLGLIHVALPRAKIIHCRRDPVDTCLSCFSQLFGTELSYTYDLEELGHYYRGYANLMEHWRKVLPDGAMLEVSYEEVVANFEPEVRRLLDFCDLEFDPACLDFHKTPRAVRTASTVQIRSPLKSSSESRVRPPAELLDRLKTALGQ